MSYTADRIDSKARRIAREQAKALQLEAFGPRLCSRCLERPRYRGASGTAHHAWCIPCRNADNAKHKAAARERKRARRARALAFVAALEHVVGAE